MVEEIIGSELSKEWKWVPYLGKWRGYPYDTDWTEQWDDHFADKKLLKKLLECNPQAAKNQKFSVELVSFLLEESAVQGGCNCQQ
jgi:hypothetical protein